MKHTIPITFLLVILFLVAQVLGLLIVNQYLDHGKIKETSEVGFKQLPYDVERPPIEEGSSFIYIIAAILIGTLILLVLIKFRFMRLWKIWFLLAVILTLSFALSAFLNPILALILSIIFGLWKVYKPNMYVHNLTEVFIYGGLAAIFVPVINLFSAIILLLAISAYDFIAVWKSKHMVTLAKFHR
jgi:presenilin-like A22 family membrane protease